MAEYKPIIFRGASEMPELVVSIASMMWNKTGSWRYLKPRYSDRVPPCNEGCPAGNDIEGFVRLIGEGKPAEAWRLLKEENPIPAVTGRVCFHPCETACNRGKYDQTTSIQALERYVADHATGEIMKPLRKSSGKKVAVVGAGPAGISAAYHLTRLGHKVTIFDALPKAGGLLRIGIPAYRLPDEILDKEIADLEKMGIEFVLGARVGKDVSFEKMLTYDAVFVATGVHANRALDVPGEEAKGVMPGLALLTKVALGEKVKIGKRVAVIGGGNSAVDAARAALRLGAHVTIYYRRTEVEMPAFEEEVEDAKAEGVKLEILTAPSRIIVEDGAVAGLELRRMMLGEPDESGRCRPLDVKGSEFTVPCDMVLTAIGEYGDLSFLPDEIKREWGKIKIDDFGLTSHPSVFAGGDIASAQQNVARAIGDGKRAAIAVDRRLNGATMEEIGGNIIIGQKGCVSAAQYLQTGQSHAKHIGGKHVVPFEEINQWHFEKMPRDEMPRLSLPKRAKTFGEINLGFTDEQAAHAAERCFHCGVCTMCDNCYMFCPDVAIAHKTDGGYGYDINFDYCKGCGICVKECPRSAMVLEEE